MFYQKQTIDKNLTCVICQRMFDDPRVLPCGHTFCHECLERRCSSNRVLCCPECKTSHDLSLLPTSGFPVNLIAKSLCDEQPKEVIQSHHVKELTQKLDLLDTKRKELVKRLRAGSDEIREHCVSLRRQIDLSTEVRLEEIRKQSEAFKKQVDEYERERLVSYDDHLGDKINQEFDPYLTDINRFYSQTLMTLGQFEVADDDVNRLITSTDDYLSQIDNKESSLGSMKFNGKLMTFEAQSRELESSSLGFIDFKDLVILKSHLNFDSTKSTKIVMPNDHSLLHLVKKDEHNILFASRVKSEIKLIYYDTLTSKITAATTIQLRQISNGSSVNCRLLSLWSCKSDNILIFRVYPFSLYVGFHLYVSNLKQTLSYDTKTFLLRIGPHCDYQKHRGVSHFSEYQATNSSGIFCLDLSKHKIWVYSTSLVDTGAHLTDNIPSTVVDMIASDKHLFLLHTDTGSDMQIRVIDIQHKTVHTEITLPSVFDNQLKFVSPNCLFVFNNQESCFTVIDTDEFTTTERHVKVAQCLFMSKDDSPTFYFYDSKGVKSSLTIED